MEMNMNNLQQMNEEELSMYLRVKYMTIAHMEEDMSKTDNPEFARVLARCIETVKAEAADIELEMLKRI